MILALERRPDFIRTVYSCPVVRVMELLLSRLHPAVEVKTSESETGVELVWSYSSAYPVPPEVGRLLIYIASQLALTLVTLFQPAKAKVFTEDGISRNMFVLR